ncbi:MAG: hypothetical protein JWN30_269 [Bacilli bacterium]|nr:hypothetical protein [Bacilli bacterium]
MLALFCMTGCYDRIELEDQAFIVAMGFDKGPNHTIDVTVRLAVPSKLGGGAPGAGGGGGGGGEDLGLSGSKPITVRAHTITEAMNLVNTGVERRVSLVECKLIVFGQDLARDGVHDVLSGLSRFREFRQTTYLQLAKGKASEVMSTEKPVYEQTDVRFAEDVALIGRQTGFVPRSTIHDFLNNLAAAGEDPFVPILAVNKKVKQAADQDKAKDKGGGGGGQGSPSAGGMSNEKSSAQENQPKLLAANPKYDAGQVVRLGGNPVEFIGTAIFRGDRLVATLDGVQTRMLLALRGELERIQLEITSPFDKTKYTGVEITRIARPKISYELNRNPIRIHVHLDMEGNLYGDQAGTDYTNPANVRVLEQQVNTSMQSVQDKIISDVLNGCQADPFGLFRRARSQFATNAELENFSWRQKCKTAVVDVTNDFKMRRTGLILSPIQESNEDLQEPEINKTS